ncbi:MAG: hypothetical protein IPJ88_16690 [Myxococcales bacterium]|nr:MAG: hypothetical protein IPJ88_16690 [Myxococcales bacterium]
MIKKLSPIVSLVLALQFVPGLGELVESAVHFAVHGHSAHALSDTEHQSQEAEHGCSGPFHLCPCHSTVAYTMQAAVSGVVAPARDDARPKWWIDGDGPTDAHLAGVFRPPLPSSAFKGVKCPEFALCGEKFRVTQAPILVHLRLAKERL